MMTISALGYESLLSDSSNPYPVGLAWCGSARHDAPSLLSNNTTDRQHRAEYQARWKHHDQRNPRIQQQWPASSDQILHPVGE